MARMTVSIDPELMRDAQAALGASSKAETLRLALTEVVRRRRLAASLEHQGKIELRLDQKKLARLRSEG